MLCFIVLRMSWYCVCSVALPHGAVGLSTMCDCGVSNHTHLLFTIKKIHVFTRKSNVSVK